MNYYNLLIYTVTAIAICSLVYGSYTDVTRRTVKALLFVPLVISAIVESYVFGFSLFYILIGSLMFLFTFLDPDTYAYLVFGAFFIIVSFLSMFISGLSLGFHMLVMSIVFLLGFQERLFGIGDIKAIIALMFASPFYIQLIYYVIPQQVVYPAYPTALALLTDICIFAVLFVVYAVVIAYRHGVVRVSGRSLAMRYSEELEKKNPAAYRTHEKNGIRYMVYRIPFVVPITLGYILFITAGFLPSLI